MTIYASSARFDTKTALDNDQLRKLAPSIFADAAHESRSERFKAIPTINVLDALRTEGFFPVAAMQNRASADRHQFTKHMIRLRRFDGKQVQVGDNVNEIILKNANDGTSTYRLMSGMFRIRCMNSLVAQTSTLDEVVVRHSGNVVDKVIEGTYKVLDETANVMSAIENCVKGGLTNINPRGRRCTTKGVANIEGNLNLNKALWMLGDKMSRLAK